MFITQHIVFLRLWNINRSGRILLQINAGALDFSYMEGGFYIKFHLYNKVDKSKWILMAIYGPAQDDFKSTFLAELVRAYQENPLPTLIGGDFNILCKSSQKTNNPFNDQWPFLFNAAIDKFDSRLHGHTPYLFQPMKS